MEECVIVISDEEETEARPRKRRRKAGQRAALADLIDLTEDDAHVSDGEHSDVAVIDLTSLEGMEDFLNSCNTSVDLDQESSDSGDNCLFIKEESSNDGSWIPDVGAQLNRPLDLGLLQVGTSLGANSSNDCNKHSRKLSESSTTLNSDRGSLESILPETHTSTYSSSNRSRHTSEEWLLDDPQDSNAKSCCRTSPALQEKDTQNLPLRHRTASTENCPLLCSRQSSNGRPFLESQPLVSNRESSNSRPSLENLPHVSSRESSNGRPSLGNPLHVSARQPSNSRPSLENPSHVSSRESSNSRPSLENPLHVSIRESSNGRPSIETPLHFSSRESSNRPSLENPLHVSSRGLCDTPSLENPPLVSSLEPSNSIISPENPPHVSSRESCDSRSSQVSSKESCDRRHSLENPPLIYSKEPVYRRPCLGTPCPRREPSNIPHLDFSLPQLDCSFFQGLREMPPDHQSAPRPQPCPCTGSRNGPDEDTRVSSAPGVASRAWLNKLKYFRKLPIHHLFFQGLKQDAETIKNRRRKPVLISDRRLNMVTTTIEEDFSQGTLQFLMEFVSPQHYPPKHIVEHVIRRILLCSEDLDVLTEAYTLLMRIQQFHPASISTVGWDWKLLNDIMEEKDKEVPGHILFLRYVLQTLEDDFQANLVKRALQITIAKTMLSCDQHFSNIRAVIRWLIDAVTSCSPEDEPRSSPPLWPDVARNTNQMVVCILQRMLTMAVEVDKSPTLNSSSMANAMFPYVLSIRRRCQRETFFNTMESHLLRGKVLEVMFNYSCEPQPTCSLSLTKILHFLKHSMFLLEDEGSSGEWQKWDEMLHHLYLLFISYESIVYEHLRTPLNKRVDLTVQKTKAPLMEDDIISKEDIDLHLEAFCRRVSQGPEKMLHAQLQERTQVLRTVLYTAVHWPPS